MMDFPRLPAAEKVLVVLFLLSLASASVFGQDDAVSRTGKTKHPSSEATIPDRFVGALLEYDYQMAGQLSTTDRAELLLRLSETAVACKHPEYAEQWAKEVLQAVSGMNAGPRRSEYEAHALRDLALANSDAALALLSTLQFPASVSGRMDLSSQAANAVFNQFLTKHPKGWGKIIAASEAMGGLGAYPFRAVQNIIGRIGNTAPDQASLLVQQAVHYYNLAPITPLTNHQLAALLLEHSRFADRSFLASALSILVARLLEATSPDMDSSHRVASESFDQLNQATFSQLLPLIKSLDSRWAEQLERDHPTLGSAGLPTFIDLADGSSTIASIQGVGPSSADKAAGEQTKPDTPEPMAVDLSAKPTAEEMSVLQKFFDQSWKQAGDDLDKLHLLLSRTSIFAATEKRHELSSLLSPAFALGENLFLKSVEDDAAESWAERPGAAELSDMVKLSARLAPEEVLHAIEALRSTVLRAELLATMAESLEHSDGAPLYISMGTSGTQK